MSPGKIHVLTECRLSWPRENQSFDFSPSLCLQVEHTDKTTSSRSFSSLSLARCHVFVVFVVFAVEVVFVRPMSTPVLCIASVLTLLIVPLMILFIGSFVLQVLLFSSFYFYSFHRQHTKAFYRLLSCMKFKNKYCFNENVTFCRESLMPKVKFGRRFQ